MKSCHSPSQNSPMTSYTQNSLKLLTMSFKVHEIWPCLSLSLGSSSSTGIPLFTPLQPHWSICCTSLIPSLFLLQNFYIYMLSLLLEMLPYDLSMTHSFTSLNSLLNCSLSKEAFLDYAVVQQPTLCSSLSSFTVLFFTYDHLEVLSVVIHLVQLFIARV